MHRLSGEDTGFLAMESPAQPMSSMAVGLLRPPAGPDGRAVPLTLADVRRHVEGRLDQLPSFRWRIVRVPFGLHHPVAVRDPRFDLAFHLRTAVVGGDGSLRDLDACFAALAERRLDRRHPLWQLTLVSGLADGRQALVLKYHHCLADGVAAFTTFSRVYSDLPFDPLPGVALPWEPERLPGCARLLADALRDHARALASIPRLALRTRRRVAAAKARKAAATTEVPGFSGEAPRTALNQAFTAPRSYGRASIDLTAARALKDAAGTTLNDVCLAVVAGAARRYLADHGGVPAEPLLTSVPVSYEPSDAPTRQAGNRFWSFTTSLATHVEDPWERLQAISATAAEARRQLDALGPELMPAWLDLVPPFVAEPGARALVARLRAGDGPVDANVLVSNIRGPAEPWSVCGAEVEDLWVDGPPSNGVGVNVMLWSYAGRLLLGVLCFAEAVPDADELVGHLHDAFAELQAAVASRAAAPAPAPA
ncbi:wax ester/triacylglycerol synthase family O-acyltransferase [Aquihabitans sp. G128]|uniref:wax ester/triacylglycerol synthase family O-acyltransferase n=1 Tax=Aquihabitans sp. G128 TaxID=2849779 RepID=UPI001C23BE9F|nr:wax ester/triacylglycerol synthase family O-acyltransferase [Aquihabitans sp. G128]QXC59431.1 wax ester/triacylglycerol synthase family O-acyltransferase [Aquihabitans sp. G128]